MSTNPLLISAPDDTPIWQIWLSAYHLPAVAVADEIGLFRELALGSASAEDLADRLKIELRAVEALSGVMVPLGLLLQLDGRLDLTDVARKCLVPDSPFYWGPFLQRVRETPLDCRKLIASLRRGTAAEDSRTANLWEAPAIAPERLRSFTHAMHSHSFGLAVRAVPAMELGAVHAFLDVGGGSGSFSIAAALHHASLKCTVMDLPAVCEVAGEYVAKHGVQDRVTSRPVDMFKEPWPEGFDGIFFNDIFHDWNDAQCLFLAERARDAVAPGGRVMAHEMLLTDTKDGPLSAATYSVVMLFAAPGRQRSARQMTDIFTKAGLIDVRVKPTISGYAVIEGRRE
jgi:hypothetical protein